MRWLFPLLLAACSSPAPEGTDPPPACENLGQPPATPAALEPTAATYLGLGAGDAANAVDLAPDCTVVVGGRFEGTDFGQAPAVVAGGTGGAVLRLDPRGQKVLKVVRLGTVVSDLEVRRDTGAVAVASDAGVAVLEPGLGAAAWAVGDQGPASRVAVAGDGTVAALFGKTLRVYDASGALLFSKAFGDAAVNDVAVDAVSRRVFVTGFKQDDGYTCGQLQIAWVRAFDYRGAPAWKAYDWDKTQAGDAGLCADTRGMRVAMGRDGYLYFAGESAGGNFIYSRDPQDFAEPAANVKRGPYHDAYNTASNHITYYTRLEPATGAQLLGQVLLARLGSGKGNTIRPLALAADEAGRVYVGGIAACCIAARDALSLNGRTLPPYAGDDAWVLVTSPDFRADLLWMVWNAGGKGEVRGLAAAGGAAALAAVVRLNPFHTHRALQEAGPGGYASVWPGWPPAP